MHRGRAKASVLPVHKSSSSKKSSEEPKRIPALAYIAACFAIGVLIGKALRPEMAEFAPAAPAAAASATKAPTAAATQKKLDPRVYAFYYAWYQNPATDGLWAHWNHKHLDHWDAAVRAKYPPFVHDPEKRDVGASFFPALGAYSSADDAIIEKHFAQLREAKVGVAVVSWYPPGKRDANCLLYTSPSPRDRQKSRMPSSA